MCARAPPEDWQAEKGACAIVVEAGKWQGTERAAMNVVRVRRLDGSELVVNADLIEAMEATPDTIITLTTGKKIVVKDQVDEVVARVIAYKRTIMCGLLALTRDTGIDSGAA